MTQYVNFKQEFIREIVLRGAATIESAPTYIKEAVPDRILTNWLTKFYRAPRPSSLPMHPRLMNHFCLGADPEFVFFNPKTGLVNAETFNLKAGLCIGADNNGRLVELRPQPSRFALEVLASMLAELRWLALMYPETITCNWKAGAWSGHDGLGGHVHLGRKLLKTRDLEVQALDRITWLLYRAGVFDAGEVRTRQSGGQYGLFGQIRPQAHGYEYRTFPSWLQNPWLAYLCLVVSKIVVFNPFALNGWDSKQFSAAEARKRIRNLLAQYKAMDDDALFAYLGLDVWGLPNGTEAPKDFKPFWGITGYVKELGMKQPFKMPSLLPPYIKASQRDVSDLFFHITQGRPLGNYYPEAPEWPLVNAPEGFYALQEQVKTRVQPGMGEFCWDILTPVNVNAKIEWLSNVESRTIGVGDGLIKLLDNDILNRLKERLPFAKISNTGGGLALYLSKNILTPNYLPAVKAAITDGLFPFVRHRNLEKFDLSFWKVKTSLFKKRSKPEAKKYKILYSAR